MKTKPFPAAILGLRLKKKELKKQLDSIHRES